jgi:Transposase
LRGPRARILQGGADANRSFGGTLAFIGIDVAKAQLEFACLPSGETGTVSNEDQGIRELVTRCQALTPTLIVLEATGGYEAALVAALATAGLPVVIANPRQVRDFAKATGQLAKTDRIDAQLLALFAERVRPAPRPLPDEAAQTKCASAAGRQARPRTNLRSLARSRKVWPSGVPRQPGLSADGWASPRASCAPGASVQRRSVNRARYRRS